MPAPIDKLPDPHAELRIRLAALGKGQGALTLLGRQVGLEPDALHAFLGGSHLAGWAAERLARALDQEQAGRDG